MSSSKLAVVLSQTLSGVVVQLNTRVGMAVGVEGVEGHMVIHTHVAGDLQTMVRGALIRIEF